MVLDIILIVIIGVVGTAAGVGLFYSAMRGIGVIADRQAQRRRLRRKRWKRGRKNW